jgi:hypothetical protein
MKKISTLLENCNCVGLKFQSYEADYLDSIFELNLQGNYNLLLESNNCILILNEFFNKSMIRYCDTEKNIFLIEKIAKEIKEFIKEAAPGRNKKSKVFLDNGGYNISPEKISAEKNGYFESGINPHTGDECTTIKIEDEVTLKSFDSPEAAQLYSRNVSRMFNVKN